MPMRAITVPLLVCMMWFAVTVRAAAPSNDIAVLVNPDNSISNITSADLRKVFSGQKRSWPGGARIRLIVRPVGSHERDVLLHLLRMSESEYKQYWTAQVYRGEADSEPLVLPSFGMVLEATRAFPGAIAFVEARDIKAGMYLKVIKVDGLMPGDSGYPLH